MTSLDCSAVRAPLYVQGDLPGSRSAGLRSAVEQVGRSRHGWEGRADDHVACLP